MAKKKSHKDVDFHVSDGSGRDLRYDTMEDAAATAIALAVSHGMPVTIDVVVHSASGARWLSGDYGVEVYSEDPEASVFERIVVRADSQGRIA